MAPQYKVFYFDVRALAEPIRLILSLKGVEFEDVRLPKDEWPELKKDYPYGSLPVLHVGDKVLAQSGAIQRYLAKKFDLWGSDDYEAAKCDEVVEAMTDLRLAVFKGVFESDPTRKEELIKTAKNEALPKFLAIFEEILKSNGTGFLVGKKVSYADLNIANFIQIYSEMEQFPGVIDGYPNIKNHQNKIFNLDGIKEWVAKRPKTQF